MLVTVKDTNKSTYAQKSFKERLLILNQLILLDIQSPYCNDLFDKRS